MWVIFYSNWPWRFREELIRLTDWLTLRKYSLFRLKSLRKSPAITQNFEVIYKAKQYQYCNRLSISCFIEPQQLHPGADLGLLKRSVSTFPIKMKLWVQGWGRASTKFPLPRPSPPPPPPPPAFHKHTRTQSETTLSIHNSNWFVVYKNSHLS